MSYLPPGEREELENQIEAADRDSKAAQAKGDQSRFLEKLELGLRLRQKVYSEPSNEINFARHRLCEVCNAYATEMLQKNNLKVAHDLLKRAEEVSEKDPSGKAITFNNLACYYRRTNKMRAAVTYLERALEIEANLNTSDVAQTHLNLCATLSALGKHGDALYHAQRALIRIYETMAPLMLSGKLHLGSGGSPGDPNYEQVTVMCMAYHNVAVEHEYLKNYEDSILAYAEGVRWADGFLGTHQLSSIMRESLDHLKVKLPANSGAVKRALETIKVGWGPIKSSSGGADGGSYGGAASPAGANGRMDLLSTTPRGQVDGNGSVDEDRPRQDSHRSRSNDSRRSHDSRDRDRSPRDNDR